MVGRLLWGLKGGFFLLRGWNGGGDFVIVYYICRFLATECKTKWVKDTQDTRSSAVNFNYVQQFVTVRARGEYLEGYGNGERGVLSW